MEDYRRYCDVAHALLDAALPVLKENYAYLIAQARKGDIRHAECVQWKAEQKQEVVTKGEQQAEKIMRELVKATFPSHDIAGEEWGYAVTDSPFLWVFDPIDGTAAMLDAAIHEAHGTTPPPAHMPYFGITIGLLHHHRPVLGMVHDFIHHHRWCGGMGVPATCNNVPISVPPPPALAEATLSCTAPSVMFADTAKRAAFEALSAHTKHTVTNRNCIGFMQLLDGSVQMVWEGDLAFHDVVALFPILEQAGICFSDEQGQAFSFTPTFHEQEYRVIAAHPDLYNTLLAHSNIQNSTSQSSQTSAQEGFYTRKF